MFGWPHNCIGTEKTCGDQADKPAAGSHESKAGILLSAETNVRATSPGELTANNNKQQQMFRKIQHNPKVLHRVICNVQFSTPNYYTCQVKRNEIHEKGEKIRQEKVQTNPDVGLTKDFKAAVVKKTNE